MTKKYIKTLYPDKYKYRMSFESVGDKFAVFELTYNSEKQSNDAVVINVNQAFCEFYGLSREKLIGKKVSELSPEIEAGWLDLYGNVLQTGKPLRLEEYYSSVDRWFEVYVCSLHAGHQYVLIIADITQRKKTEAKLRCNKMSAEILFEVAGKLLGSDRPQEIVEELCLKVMGFLDCRAFFNYLIDEEVNKLHLNACAGVSEEAAGKVEWLDYGDAVCGCVARDKCSIVVENIQQIDDPRTTLIKTLGIRAYACNPLIVQNRIIGTLAFATCSRDSFGMEELALMKAVTDQVAVAMNRIKTEKMLRKHQEDLLKAEREKYEVLQNVLKMKDEFLYTISHEFKTPLTVINSTIQTMEAICKNEISEKLRGYHAKIKQNTFRQIRLVRNLLDITKIESDHTRLNMKNHDIVLLTRVIIDSVKLYALQKGIELKLSTSMKKKQIALDDEKYERILLNLLSNAIKFTPKDKSITVKIFGISNKVCIQIIDTGVGIPGDKLETIFERFGQVDSSLTRQAEGTGIGLSLVKMLSTVLGGEIHVESEEGKGSTFTLFLPDKKIRKGGTVKEIQQINERRIQSAIAVECSDIYI